MTNSPDRCEHEKMSQEGANWTDFNVVWTKTRFDVSNICNGEVCFHARNHIGKLALGALHIGLAIFGLCLSSASLSGLPMHFASLQ